MDTIPFSHTAAPTDVTVGVGGGSCIDRAITVPGQMKPGQLSDFAGQLNSRTNYCETPE